MAGARGKPVPSHSSLPGVVGQHTTTVEQATTKMRLGRNITRIGKMSTLDERKGYHSSRSWLSGNFEAKPWPPPVHHTY